MENLQILLNSVNAILREEKIKKEESLRRGERFNVFQICGVDHYEVKHSAIIARILDPKGNHGQGDKFLKIFLQIIKDSTGIDTTSCSVNTEYVTNEGRIDILIEDKTGKGIIIENKIYAGDQSEQLKRYDKFSKEKYKTGQYTIYYLTLDEHYASGDSGEGINYSRISYKEHILNWIEESIKESAATPLIRETLIQYKNHIKQLTNQDMDTMNKEELIKKMVNNPEAVATLFSVQDDYKKYAFNNYVRPTFEKFCSENDLIYDEINLFEYGEEKGFFFRRKNWMIDAIWIYTYNKRNNCGFFWGISNYNGEAVPLDSSSYHIGGKADLTWPFGSASLEKYSDWDDMNTVAAMINGEFSKYVIDVVRKALEDIDEKQIQIP